MEGFVTPKRCFFGILVVLSWLFLRNSGHMRSPANPSGSYPFVGDIDRCKGTVFVRVSPQRYQKGMFSALETLINGAKDLNLQKSVSVLREHQRPTFRAWDPPPSPPQGRLTTSWPAFPPGIRHFLQMGVSATSAIPSLGSCSHHHRHPCLGL